MFDISVPYPISLKKLIRWKIAQGTQVSANEKSLDIVVKLQEYSSSFKR